MANYPIYWPKSGWVLGLKHTEYVTQPGGKVKRDVSDARRGFVLGLNADYKKIMTRDTEVDDSVLTEADLKKVVPGKVLSKYWTATLDRNSDVFGLIEAYVCDSVRNSPYRAVRWEGARMKNRGLGPGMLPAMLNKDKLPQMQDESGIRITKIKVVYNPFQWSKYTTYRGRSGSWTNRKTIDDEVRFVAAQRGKGGFRIPVIDPQMGEVYLFHGTSKSTSNLIARSSFDPTRCDRRRIGGYGSLGQGTYLSDNFAKIAIYTRCPKCGANAACGCTGKSGHAQERVALLSRVVFHSDTRTTTEKPSKQLHSSITDVQKSNVLIGVPKYNGTEKIKSAFPNNVFLVTDPKQVYPEFIIYFQWSRPGYELKQDLNSGWGKAHEKLTV